MVDYSLSNDRLIGMIQQQENKDLYKIGCFGKITAFNETPDKRYLISLEGISCFKISKEIKTKHKFRIFKVENIKIPCTEPDIKSGLPSSYDVAVSKSNLSRFRSKNGDLTYYIALEPDSTFE